MADMLGAEFGEVRYAVLAGEIHTAYMQTKEVLLSRDL